MTQRINAIPSEINKASIDKFPVLIKFSAAETKRRESHSKDKKKAKLIKTEKSMLFEKTKR